MASQQRLGLAHERSFDPAAFARSAPDNSLLLEATRVLNTVGLTANSFEELISGIKLAFEPLIAVESIGIAVWVEEGQYLQSVPGSFGGTNVVAASNQIDGMDQSSGAARVMLTGRAWFTNDPIHHIPAFESWTRAYGTRQLMSVPLSHGDERFGVLSLANIPGGFSISDLSLVEDVAPFVAAAVQHVRSRIALTRNEALFTSIAETASAVAGGRALRRLSTGPLTRFCAAMRASMLVVSFVGEARPRVLLTPDEVPERLSEQLLRETAAPRHALRVRQVRSTGLGDVGATFVHAPVMVAGGYQASLSFLRVPGEPLDADERGATRRMANVIALAWATESYRKEFELRARLDERQRIADDLHDYVAQILFSAELNLQSMIEDLAEDASLLSAATLTRDLLVRSEVSLRDVIHRLSTDAPSPRLSDMLANVVHEVEGEFGIAIRLEVGEADAARSTRVPDALASVVIRAAREGMINAAKHARPCRVTVSLRISDDNLLLSVLDDGASAPGLQVGHGLAAIRRMLREHGGTARFSRESAGLSAYRVSVPFLAR